MKVMILAAGRGERMKPLTDTCPKPLLEVAGKPLIVHHLLKLAGCGLTDIVINHAWLGDKIVEKLGDGSQFGVNIQYSAEPQGALETAGGIIKALPLLDANNKNEPFLLINGDVYTDFDFKSIPQLNQSLLAHIWLTKNPEHNPLGDFCFREETISNKYENIIKEQNSESFTFSGISVFRPSFFVKDDKHQIRKLGPMIKEAVERKVVSASMLDSLWVDVGTPERLEQLNLMLVEED